MKSPLAFTLVAMLVFAALPASAAERACRPSLSNMYHCPDTSPAAKPTKTASPSGRACRPSLSNLWTCPDTSKPPRKSTGTTRACRPSLSNGYSCPGTTSQKQESPPARKTASKERPCRPSLSNGYKCPEEGQAGANQYSSERTARAHCFTDTVVWANTESNIYHFRGTYRYGNTKAGAYMCEQDSLAEGMRAAKNETHP
jgi:hypothetical protein